MHVSSAGNNVTVSAARSANQHPYRDWLSSCHHLRPLLQQRRCQPRQRGILRPLQLHTAQAAVLPCATAVRAKPLDDIHYRFRIHRLLLRCLVALLLVLGRIRVATRRIRAILFTAACTLGRLRELHLADHAAGCAAILLGANKLLPLQYKTGPSAHQVTTGDLDTAGAIAPPAHTCTKWLAKCLRMVLHSCSAVSTEWCTRRMDSSSYSWGNCTKGGGSGKVHQPHNQVPRTADGGV